MKDQIRPWMARGPFSEILVPPSNQRLEELSGIFHVNLF